MELLRAELFARFVRLIIYCSPKACRSKLTAMITETITCQQLCEQGLSQYQVRTVTQELVPIHSEQGISAYCLRDVIAEVRHYLQANRLPPLHREAVHDALISLLEQLDNVVAAPFGLCREQQIGFHIQKLLQTQAPFLKPTAPQAEPASVVFLKSNCAEPFPPAPTDLFSS